MSASATKASKSGSSSTTYSRADPSTHPAAWEIFEMRAVLSFTFTAACLAGLNAASLTEKQKFYFDDPLWTSPRPTAADRVITRKLSDFYDFFENTFFPAGERAPHTGIFL